MLCNRIMKVICVFLVTQQIVLYAMEKKSSDTDLGSVDSSIAKALSPADSDHEKCKRKYEETVADAGFNDRKFNNSFNNSKSTTRRQVDIPPKKRSNDQNPNKKQKLYNAKEEYLSDHEQFSSACHTQGSSTVKIQDTSGKLLNIMKFYKSVIITLYTAEEQSEQMNKTSNVGSGEKQKTRNK